MPEPFSSVLGHPVARVELCHLLEQARAGRFILFQGPQGVGKGTFARIFGRALLCDQREGARVCGGCPSCLGKNLPDLLITEPSEEGERVGIEAIREIQAVVPFPPFRGKFRVWVIDPLEALTLQAQEALLRTLEEPPLSLWILGITHAGERLPLTLRSRAIKILFHALSPEILRTLLPDTPNELLPLGSVSSLTRITRAYPAIHKLWEKLLTEEPYNPQEAGQFPKKAEKFPGGFAGFVKTLLELRNLADREESLYHEKLYRWVEENTLLHSALMDLEANVNPSFVSESVIRELRRLRKKRSS